MFQIWIVDQPVIGRADLQSGGGTLQPLGLQRDFPSAARQIDDMPGDRQP